MGKEKRFLLIKNEQLVAETPETLVIKDGDVFESLSAAKMRVNFDNKNVVLTTKNWYWYHTDLSQLIIFLTALRDQLKKH